MICIGIGLCLTVSGFSWSNLKTFSVLKMLHGFAWKNMFQLVATSHINLKLSIFDVEFSDRLLQRSDLGRGNQCVLCVRL